MGKKTLIQFTSTLFYSNFFIASCAAVLVNETGSLLKLLSGPQWFSPLVFCCTLNIYCLHYYLKSLKHINNDRLNWYRSHRQLILIILISGTGIIFYLLSRHRAIVFSKTNIVWSLLIPAVSIAYSFPFLPGGRALRHFGWLKLPLLSFVWSFVTVCLAVFYSGENKINQTQLWVLFANRFFFIMALAMLFNVRDYEEDKKDNIKTPAVVYGAERTLQTGKWVMAAINIITSLLLAGAFNFTSPLQYAAVFLPVVLLFLLFHFFRYDNNEIRFSTLHDGLMPVKALLLIFAAL